MVKVVEDTLHPTGMGVMELVVEVTVLAAGVTVQHLVLAPTLLQCKLVVTEQQTVVAMVVDSHMEVSQAFVYAQPS